MAQAAHQPHISPWRSQWDDLLRAFGSSFVFGITLLYTMEVWWVGITAELWKSLLFLLFAFSVNLFLGYYAGFCRKKHFRENLFHGVVSFVIGLFLAVICLLVLNEVNIHTPFETALGKVIVMSVPFGIGAFLTDRIIPFLSGRLSGPEDENETSDGEESSGESDQDKFMKYLLLDIGATIAGGIFIGLPISPTEEVPMIATRLGFWHEISMVVLTLIASYIIVFETERQEDEECSPDDPIPFLQKPFQETVFCYAISLVLALILLVLFDQVSLDTPLPHLVSQVLVLGFPIAVGGAAGRLAV